MEKYTFKVEENQAGSRLDKFLCDKLSEIKPEITRSKIQKIIEDNQVFDEQNQGFTNSAQKVKLAQEISINIATPKAHNLIAKEIDFEIVYEDDDLLVINKPAGLTVHPGTGNQENTLVNALLFTHKNNLSSINGEFRPGIVHRLDKDTSGLMLVAKNDFTHNALGQDLQDRKIKRSYLAFIYGVLNPKIGRIDKNIARSRLNRLKMAVTKNIANSRTAITNYETLEIFHDGFVSLVECRLETGRTHQIRLHMESAKHSLVGDQVYNGCKKTAPKDLDDKTKNFIANFARQALHSYKISFLHPKTKKEMSFEIDLPQDLRDLRDALV